MARIPLSRSALIRILSTIQNAPFYRSQDILTYTGSMSHEEVGQHVWSCFKALADAEKRATLDSLATFSRLDAIDAQTVAA